METKTCQFCGTPLEENAVVCTNCGRLPEQVSPAQQPQPAQPNQQPVKQTSGLAVASLVLGIIAIIFSLIPIIRVIVYVLAPLALVFGLIPLIKKQSMGVSVAGVAIAAVALVLTIVFQAATFAAVDKAVDSLGNSVSDSVSDDSPEKNVQKETPTQPKKQKQMTASELEAEIAKQEVRVTSTKYTVQNKDYKVLYPDLLQAIITNGSTVDIQDVVIAYVAWDKNNLPVEIETSNILSDEAYIKRASATVNLVPGGTWGRESGLELASDCSDIATFKAIVCEYTDFDGKTWENPLYDQWCEIYEGKRLS